MADAALTDFFSQAIFAMSPLYVVVALLLMAMIGRELLAPNQAARQWKARQHHSSDSSSSAFTPVNSSSGTASASPGRNRWISMSKPPSSSVTSATRSSREGV